MAHVHGMTHTKMTRNDLHDHLSKAGPEIAAQCLLGRHLRVRNCEALIVEVEAYGSDAAGPWPDPASHAYPGLTARNPVMFGKAGRLYVYRIYGMHLCANISFGPEGHAGAVLLRAAAITDGLECARTRRQRQGSADSLASGPANLVQALGISMDDQGADVVGGNSDIILSVDKAPGLREMKAGPRVGIARAADRRWRYWIADHPAVSRYRRHTRAGP